jgi:hypothetical protein
MALYFSKFTPDGTGEDLYSRLLSALRGCGKLREAIFGSLNYDCIFEQAASRLGESERSLQTVGRLKMEQKKID